MSSSGDLEWRPTRAAGLDRLRAFVARAGRAYAAQRNYDDGPQQRSNVSCLSPWIRHRLVVEEEVLTAVLEEHSPQAADKFIQELCWRTYWKGWLEMRPQVWRDYRAAVTALHTQLEGGGDLCARWQEATSGATGIDCLDHWTRELVETGYLHNHARMWFASIWIFTLRLPWELGADFFLRYLLDGDAASNTLSWRWVAGLQTPGKTYLARADNIARYTRGRFRPRERLAVRAEPPSETQVVAPRPPETPVPPATGRRTGLLLTDDDLCGDKLPMPRDVLVAIAGFSSAPGRSPWPVSRGVLEFSDRALDDGLGRAGDSLGLEATRLDPGELRDRIIAWCERHQLGQVLLPYAPVGVARDTFRPAQSALEDRGVRVAQIRRDWDEQFWPHATHGYFRFKRAIRSVVNDYR